MDKLFDHKSVNISPDFPILRKIVNTYRVLHAFLDKLPKTYRYTLGYKIDTSFIEFGEQITAAFYSKDQQKISHLNNASQKLNFLNFLLKIAWEIRVVGTDRYAAIGQALAEIGRMLGGWQKQSMK